MWSVLQRRKLRIVVKNPVRKDSEFIVVQVPEGKKWGYR